jgi:hypothetical protein
MAAALGLGNGGPSGAQFIEELTEAHGYGDLWIFIV